MKLPIKKKYFDKIKEGIKNVELRDAHITFVCEETGETLRREVTAADVVTNNRLHFQDVLKDNKVIRFELG